jgi:hypothetical protein
MIEHPCRHPRCPTFAAPGLSWCAAHAPAAQATLTAQRAAFDDRRGTAHARGYDAKWAAVSRALRARYPLSPGYLTRTVYWTPAAARHFHTLREEAARAGRYLEFLRSCAEKFSVVDPSSISDLRSSISDPRSPIFDLRSLPPIFAFHASPRPEPAEVTDHIIPHRGDQELFWAEWNLQTLSKRQHDTKTATEDGGFRGAPSAPAAAAQ